MSSLIWVVLFCAALIYVYVSWLSPVYDYLGFSLSAGDHRALALTIPLVLLVALRLPARIHTFPDFFLWMIFYFVYVPAMLIVPLQGYLPDDGVLLCCALTVSFSLMGGLARAKLRVPPIVLSRRSFMLAFWAMYTTLNIVTIAFYGTNLRLVTLADVYSQRDIAANLTAGSLVGYVTGVLSGAFNPFLIALGLVERRMLCLVVGFAGQLLIYATSAPKFVILASLVTPMLYLLLLKRPVISSNRLGPLIFASCLIPLALLQILEESRNELGTIIASIVFMRTYGTTGALTGVYAEFFTRHAHTFYSHINLISTIIPYPYAQSLGEEIGYDLVGGPLDANAHFWATDGIAAAGNLGVILIGGVVGVFLSLCNGIFNDRGNRLALSAFIPFIVMVSNSSFFTSLLTGGGGLLVLFVYLAQGTSSRSGVRDESVARQRTTASVHHGVQPE